MSGCAGRQGVNEYQGEQGVGNGIKLEMGEKDESVWEGAGTRELDTFSKKYKKYEYKRLNREQRRWPLAVNRASWCR